jgi:hypothetical protein
MHDDDGAYHAAAGYVYTDELALEISAIWDGIDAAERNGVPLGQIGRALAIDWHCTVILLAALGRRP